jgi:hypothetical protein
MTSITDKIIELREEMIAKGIHPEIRRDAMTAFLQGYQKHKDMFGSFRSITDGLEYQMRMQERAEFMYREAKRVMEGNNAI